MQRLEGRRQKADGRRQHLSETDDAAAALLAARAMEVAVACGWFCSDLSFVIAALTRASLHAAKLPAA